MGDAAGVGPELLAAALVDPAVRALCRPAVVGDAHLLRRAAGLRQLALRVREVNDPAAAFAPGADEPGLAACLDPTGGAARHVRPGEVSGAAGRAAADWLRHAAALCCAGDADGIVTAPLNKAALAAGGEVHPGHTEVLAEVCSRHAGRDLDVRMCLHVPPAPGVPGLENLGAAGLTVAHATLHEGLASAIRNLSPDRVAGTVRLLDGFLTKLGAARRRVGVCALNPHGGEGGLFGAEEADTIAPAADACRAAGVDAVGPLPADTLFRRAVAGEFDAVAAMYHDQGHIPLRLVGWGRAVNVTLGLPIVRTSPSHGTAFDIAWRGVADPAAMVGAVRVAAELAGSQPEASARDAAEAARAPGFGER